MCCLLKELYSYFIRINDIDCCLGEAHGSVFFQRDFPCWTLCAKACRGQYQLELDGPANQIGLKFGNSWYFLPRPY